MSGMKVVILGRIIKARVRGFTVILFATIHLCTFANLDLMFSGSVKGLEEWIDKPVSSANNRGIEFIAKGKSTK